MKTDFAKEILVIAHRVLEERRSGREVDPMRLDWARSIVAWNSTPLARAPDSAEVRAEEPQP